MKTLVRVAALAVFALPFGAHAGPDPYYEVVDGRLEFDVVGGVLDRTGVFGEAGRALKISSLTGVATGGHLWFEDGGGDARQLSAVANYRMTYTLSDWRTGEFVASNTFDGAFSFSARGWQDLPHYQYTGVGGFPAAGDAPPIFGRHRGGPAADWWSGAYQQQESGPAHWENDTFTLIDDTYYTHGFSIGDDFGGHEVIGVARGYLHVRPIPEPGVLALTGTGLGAVALAARRRRVMRRPR